MRVAGPDELPIELFERHEPQRREIAAIADGGG